MATKSVRGIILVLLAGGSPRLDSVSCFSPQEMSSSTASGRSRFPFQSKRPWGFPLSSAAYFGTPSSNDATSVVARHEKKGSTSETPFAVRAPLKYVGPYPCLSLRFPDLATSSQRKRNVTGVSLDFVIDTAANVNTLNAQVAMELDLPVVGSALPGIGASGAINGGATYLLGSAELEGMNPITPVSAEAQQLRDERENGTVDDGKDESIFMTNITASALPIASPAAAGLLSLAFLQSFSGGVEFSWGNSPSVSHGDGDGEGRVVGPPSITFHDARSSSAMKGRIPVAIQRIPVTQLPSVMVKINGVEVPALLDTGSPITVLNAQAAKLAGVRTVGITSGTHSERKGLDVFKSFSTRVQKAQAVARGHVLSIVGASGKRVDLIQSAAPVEVILPSKTRTPSMHSNDAISNSAGNVKFGSGHVYVGELPGLVALNGLGIDSPPAVVLGMDVLRRRPSMLFLAQEDEVWF